MDRKICFLSLNSYPLLAEKDLGFVGGAEVRQLLLVKELLRYNYDICYVTYSHGERDTEYLNGIEIVKTYKRKEEFTKSSLEKARNIWKALDRAQAQIYIHMSGSWGVLGTYRVLRKKPFIYGIASDKTATGKVVSKPFSTTNFRIKLDILMANTLISQNRFQKSQLKEKFGRDSVIIRNPISLPECVPEKEDPPSILWVGTFSQVKRPNLFVELAKSMPSARFRMVGGPAAECPYLYKEIKQLARRILNLEFVGFVPFHLVDDYFVRSSILVSTSEYEGFPNVFLQAWATSTPVVTLNIDPDNIVSEKKLGFVCNTLSDMKTKTEMLLGDTALRRAIGRRAREYVRKEHDVKIIAKKYSEIIDRYIYK